MTNLRLRTRVNFPASVTAEGGIGIDKSGGVWVVHPEFDDLPLLTASQLVDPTTQQIWVWSGLPSDVYSRMTLLGLSQALYTLHSTTSTLIGLGSKTFTVETNKDVSVGQNVIITSDANPSTNFMQGNITAYAGSQLTVNVTSFGGAGTFADWTIRPGGAQGPQGLPGNDAGFRYTFTANGTGDPGTGGVKFNAVINTATAFQISKTDLDSNGLGSLLASLDDSTSTMKCIVIGVKVGAPGSTLFGYINGTATDNGTWLSFPFTGGGFTGSPGGGDILRWTFYRVGDKGLDGAIAGNVGAVDNRVVRSDGVGGTTIQGSVVTIDDTGNVSGTVTVELGGVTDTTLSRQSDAQGLAVLAVEGRNLTENIPQNSFSANTTTTLLHSNTHLLHPAADNNPRTFTIDSNASVPYKIGTCLTFVNEINTLTIAINGGDTLMLSPTGATGSRSLAANGIATALKITSTKWVISGSGLS